MKKGILVAGLLFASASAVHAENYYAAPLSGGRLDRAIELPAVITGRVSSATSQNLISFEIARNYGKLPAAIYTYWGTGAVFRAVLSREEEGGSGNGISLSAESKDWTFNTSPPCVLLISAEKYQAGASYAVRLGRFGDFSVSFVDNGGTVSTNKMTYTPGRPYGRFPKATRTNYKFSGWSTAVTNGIVLTTNTQVCVGYKTLYAQWKADSVSPVTPTNPVATNCYYVAFNSNGGTGTMPNQTIVRDVAQALASNAFTRVGFDFRGWATSPTGSVVYADRAVVTNLAPVGATNTLYASWQVSPVSIFTQEVGGVVWHYSATNGEATVLNLSNGKYVAAVDTSVKGALEIPGELGGNAVVEIGERAFSGCSSVTNVVIPFGVVSIGNYAFADCTSLSPGITIPESVETMGAYVFTNCPNLKIVRYLGDCPEANEALYAGTSSSLISGVLRVRSGWPMSQESDDSVSNASASGGEDGVDDEDGVNDGGGGTVDNSASASSVPSAVRWPEGTYARRVLLWVTQPLYKVTFWEIKGVSSSAIVQYYVPGRVLASLPNDPEGTEGYTFLGWFTKPYGGTKVEDADEMIVDHSFSLYAHWHKDDGPENLSDVEYNFASAHAYDGYLLDGSEDVVGTIQLKTSRGKYRKAEEETNVTATATIVLLGEGKIRLKGTLGEDLSGTLTPTKSSDERELSVTLGGSSMEGSFDDYTVVGVRDILGKKTYLDRTHALAAGENRKGNYVVVLKADSDESSLGNGYVGLSVQVKANCKGRVTGTMPDGTKVAYTGRLEISDESCALPVVVPLHRGKKGGFGFLLTFSGESDVSVSAVSRWSDPDVPFVSALTEEGAGGVSGVASDLSFSMEDAFDVEGVDDSLLPSDVAVTASGGKWLTPKADRVKFVKADSAYEVETEYGNPSGLALSAKAGEGTFRGRFKVFAVTEAGTSKKYTATVTGAVLDGVGYGTATIKKNGAVPVTVRAE